MTASEEGVVHNLNRSLNDMAISPIWGQAISQWNLPHTIEQAYAAHGIKQLFPWQVECLTLPGVLAGKNLIYSAPTSAGKTFVAEILMLKTVLEKEKKAMFILPYKAVVKEKTKYLQDLVKDQGLKVGAFTGKQSPPGGLNSVDIAVCVIEKGNTLLNRLLEDRSVDQLGIVVIDELHQLSDGSRGYLLEILINKLLYMQHKDPNLKQIQVVGMSATLPNLSVLADWLNAELFVTDFRPVPLTQHILFDGKIMKSNLEEVGTVSFTVDPQHDKKKVAALCIQTIISGHSALVFCSTKQHVEVIAGLISNFIRSVGNNQAQFGDVSEKVRSELKQGPLAEVLKQLETCPVGLQKSIFRAVAFGVGIHHAGLSEEEREIQESAFRRGCLRVMVATSTLCSGVNLPARIVLVMYSNYLTQMMYQQMSGRAGRMGIDTKGDTYLVFERKEDLKKAPALMSPKLQLPLVSCLWAEHGVSSCLQQVILELIACEVGETFEDLRLFLQLSLHVAMLKAEEKSEAELKSAIDECILFLKTKEFIRCHDTDSDLVVATRFGKACLAASISPENGLELHQELERAQNNFVLSSELHLLYLAVPQLGVVSMRSIDWLAWMTTYSELPQVHKRVADAVGINEAFMRRELRNQGVTKNPSQLRLMEMSRNLRFRKCLALFDLVNEVPLEDVARKMDIPRGEMQAIQQSASMQAGRVTAFCRELGWHSMEVLMSSFQERLSFGVQPELCQLMKVSILNGRRARVLYDAGFTTIAQLAHATVDQIEKIFIKMGPFQASREQEGEGCYNAEVRRQMKSLFVTGQEGLSERDAAVLIINEARQLLQEEFRGVAHLVWSKPEENVPVEKNNNTLVEVTDQNKPEKNSIRPSKTVSHEKSMQVQTDQPSGTLNKAYTNQNASEISSILNEPITEDDLNVSLDKSMEVETDILNKASNQNASKESSILNRQITEDLNMSLDKSMEVENEAANQNVSKENSISNAPITDDLNVSLDKSMEVETELLNEASNAAILMLTSPHRSVRSPDIFADLSPERDAFNSNIISDETLLGVMDEFEKIPTDDPVRKNRFSFSNDTLIAAMEEFEKQPQNTPRSPDIFETSPQADKCASNVSAELSFSNKSLFELMDKIEAEHPVKTCDCFSTEFSCDNLKNCFSKVINFNKISKSKPCQVLKSFTAGTKHFKNISVSLVWIKTSPKRIGANVVGVSEATVQNSTNKYYNYDELTNNKRLVGVAFHFKNANTYYLDFTKLSGSEGIDIDNPPGVTSLEIRFLKKLLCENECGVVSYSIKSTLLVLKKLGLENLKIGGDPLVANWLLNSELGYQHILTMCAVWCPLALTECLIIAARLKPQKKDLNLADLFEAPHTKTSIEAFLTSYLCFVIHPQLEKHQLFNYYMEVELPVMEVLASCESRGLMLDRVKMKQMIDHLERRLKLMNDKTKYEVVHLNDEDMFHDCEKVEDDMQEDQKMSLFRRLKFILNNILRPIYREPLSATGRLSSTYTTFTSTGRMYSKEPSIQNIPRDFEVFKYKVSPRSLFTVAEGNVLISGDYKQMEVRLLAHFSGDQKLSKVLQSENDIFRYFASEIKGCTYEEVTQDDRQMAKKLMYSLLYGISKEKVASGLKDVDGASVVNNFRSQYPEAHAYINRIGEVCTKTVEVRSLCGRYRLLKNKSKTDVAKCKRQGTNTLIQGSAADIVKHAMIKVKNMLVENDLAEHTHLVLQLHDELIYETRERDVRSVAEIVKQGMEDAMKLNVPLPVKLSCGASWGTLKEIDFDRD